MDIPPHKWDGPPPNPGRCVAVAFLSLLTPPNHLGTSVHRYILALIYFEVLVSSSSPRIFDQLLYDTRQFSFYYRMIHVKLPCLKGLMNMRVLNADIVQQVECCFGFNVTPFASAQSFR